MAIVQLGTTLRRGGLLIHLLIGISIESIGYNQLAHLRQNLSPEKARRVVAGLQRALAEHEDTDAIEARDLYFMFQAYGWRTRLERALDEMTENPFTKPYVQSAANHSKAVNLLLQADLAIRSYRSDASRLPAELSQLTPDYLPTPPVDPYSNQPLRYHATDTDFVLYSVGWDGRDDGGAFTDAETYRAARDVGKPGFDLRLDDEDAS